MDGPGGLQLCHAPLVALASLHRRQPRPGHATQSEIFSVVLHHSEERFIGLDDPAFERPDEDSDDVRVDQTPDPRFAFFEIAIETRVLQGDRSLRREQLQHGDPGGIEDVRSQGVFQVEHADELGLVDQGQAEDRTGMMLADVRVLGKRVAG